MTALGAIAAEVLGASSLEGLRTAFGLDWQFFLVTAVALGALVLLVRTVVPGSFGGDPETASPACDHCPSGDGCAPEGAVSRGERLVSLGSGKGGR